MHQLRLIEAEYSIMSHQGVSACEPPMENQGGWQPKAAEFFAGIGLVRSALEQENWRVVFANDIAPFKRDLYAANFGSDDFCLADIRFLKASDIPDIDLATASFPCTDISLAGSRKGLAGSESGLFHAFANLLEDMESRRPPLVLIENVPSLLTSGAGQDLTAVVRSLNGMGYSCDLFTVDARWFVPQSRPRLFIVGSQLPVPGAMERPPISKLRPESIRRFALENSELALHFLPLPTPARPSHTLASVVERLDSDDHRWWDEQRKGRFLASLSSVQAARLEAMRTNRETTWATAYRRTRNGRAVWEVRADQISGCLRTARGGSSKQALVEAGNELIRLRWMTSREYAALQGAPNYAIPPDVTENQALFGFGDAICVPAVAWLAESYLTPVIKHSREVLNAKP